MKTQQMYTEKLHEMWYNRPGPITWVRGEKKYRNI